MPYYHCRKCQHEFEYIHYEGLELKCDWCGADEPIILEDQTPLEKLARNWGTLLEVLTKNGNLRERQSGDAGSTELRRKGR